MSKVKDREYLVLTAMLRAREAKMLNQERVERMLGAPSFSDMARFLTDCGYEDMSAMNAAEIENALSSHRQAIYEELGRMCPEPALIDVFRLKYDYHNAKVIVKSAAMKMECDHLLSPLGCVPAGRLKDSVSEGHFRDVPESMAKAIRKAQEVLAKTGNSQSAEFILDRAYYEEMAGLAKVLESNFLEGYVKLLIDAANLGAAVRTVRMNKSEEFLRMALFEGGNVSPAAVLDAAWNGDNLSVLFNASSLAEAASLGTEAMHGGSMTKFELACDNAVTSYLGQAKMVSFGSEAVIAYLARLEREITAIRMILTGKLAEISPAVIRERLRELNG